MRKMITIGWRNAVMGCAVLLGLAIGAPDRAAAAPGWLGHTVEFLDGVATELSIRTEQAIVLGGIWLNRNRHTVAGAAIGCAMGSAAGAVASGLAGAATGGTALIGTEAAVLLGCGAGAAVAGSMGYRLDHIYDAE